MESKWGKKSALCKGNGKGCKRRAWDGKGNCSREKEKGKVRREEEEECICHVTKQ